MLKPSVAGGIEATAPRIESGAPGVSDTQAGAFESAGRKSSDTCGDARWRVERKPSPRRRNFVANDDTERPRAMDETLILELTTVPAKTG